MNEPCKKAKLVKEKLLPPKQLSPEHRQVLLDILDSATHTPHMAVLLLRNELKKEKEGEAK